MATSFQAPVRRLAARARAEAWPLSVLAVSLLLGALGLRSKVRVMVPRWSSIARWLGHNGANDLSLLQRWDFFSSDVAVALFIMPAVGVALFGSLRRSYRFPYATLAFTSLMAITYFHMISHQVIGEYLSWSLLRDAVEWGTSNPDTITDYLPPARLVRLGALLAVTVVVLVIGHRGATDSATRVASGVLSRAPITSTTLAAGAVATLLFAAVTAVGVDIRKTPMHESALWSMTAALLAGESKAYTLRQDASYLESTREFRRMTRSDSPPSRPTLVGSMKQANLVVFVVETGPARVLDLRREAMSWRGISRLLDKSFVAENHFTTYPYTSDAVFSLLSGLYPSGRREFIRHWSSGDAPGLFTALRSAGYATAAFAPSIFARELDGKMYQTFGIDEVHNVAANPERASLPLASSYVEQAKLWNIRGDHEDHAFNRRLSADAKALAQMLAYITDRHEAEQPFGVLYLPQASHAPWHGRGTPQERGFLQMELQALALDEIVETLTALGELDNTIIVFTSDHGIRTKIEDPALSTGSATPYMLQTPLLIYAPRALSEPMRITAPTSHVDVASTVLTLLGHPEAHTTGVGAPIWEAKLDRRVYFLAEGYGGFNGFFENGEYFQFQAMTDQAYGPASAMEFDPRSVSDSHGPTASHVRSALAEYAERQSSVIGSLMTSSRLIAAGVD